MRMRKKPHLDERMERCSRVWLRNPAERRGHWRDLLPGARELRVELGCGKGKFTADAAAAEPDVLLIAVECIPDALVMAMEKAVALELNNVYYLSCDAATLPELFAPGEVDRIYLNFCDPWPHKKHARRRLTHRGFLEKYRAVLAPGGAVEFKTDNQKLFDFSLNEFWYGGWRLCQVTRDLHEHGPVGIMTGYEEKFYALGTPICRCVAGAPKEEPAYERQDSGGGR